MRTVGTWKLFGAGAQWRPGAEEHFIGASPHELFVALCGQASIALWMDRASLSVRRRRRCPACVAAREAALPKRLSPQQERVLENLRAGLPWNAHARGQSQHGGLMGTLAALQRQGYVRDCTLTEKGRNHGK